MDEILRVYLQVEVDNNGFVTLGKVRTNMETLEVISHRLVLLVDELIAKYGDNESVVFVLANTE